MPALQAVDIVDLWRSAQRDLGKGRMTDLTSDLQEHVALSRLMQKNRVKFDSGTEIQLNTLMKGDNNARNVGLFDVDNINQADGAVQGTIPWRHSTTGYPIDRRQLAMNRDPAKIFDFFKEKKYMNLAGLTQLMEPNFWGQPAAATDNTTPFGVKYWLVYNAVEGFNGGNNALFAAGPGNINRTTFPRWRNYTFNYVNVTRVDLIRKMRKAFWSCQFRPTVKRGPMPDYNTGDRYGIYTTYDVLSELEEKAEDQNDSLGRDIASMDGRVLFRRIDVEAPPYLQQNEATADPVVGINWGVFKCVFLRGEYLREDPPRPSPESHNVMDVFTDISYNFGCYDPRRCFLGAKASWH